MKLIEEKEQVQERYDTEIITIEVLECSIRDLNSNHYRIKEVLDAKVKKLQCGIGKKKALAKEEIEFLN